MNIGLIAHDSKKKLMQNFCIAYRGILCQHSLYATGTTGRLIEEAANLNVYKYLAGHLGGEQQMCSQIEQNDLDLLIFFRLILVNPFSFISILLMVLQDKMKFHVISLDLL